MKKNTKNTSELKSALDNCIRLQRKYYDHGDTSDLLPAMREADKALEAINAKVARVWGGLDTLVWRSRGIANRQYYHIIDYMCGTELEKEADKEQYHEPE
jgi:hypothetical protein